MFPPETVGHLAVSEHSFDGHDLDGMRKDGIGLLVAKGRAAAEQVHAHYSPLDGELADPSKTPTLSFLRHPLWLCLGQPYCVAPAGRELIGVYLPLSPKPFLSCPVFRFCFLQEVLWALQKAVPVLATAALVF